MSGSHKSDAEERVHDALRSALPDDFRLYANVRWIHKEQSDAPARDGETDMVILQVMTFSTSWPSCSAAPFVKWT